jgi:hypothetical protein
MSKQGCFPQFGIASEAHMEMVCMMVVVQWLSQVQQQLQIEQNNYLDFQFNIIFL